MKSPKDYLTDRVAAFKKKFPTLFRPISGEIRKQGGSITNEWMQNCEYSVETFLTETITQSMEVGKDKQNKKLIQMLENEVDYRIGSRNRAGIPEPYRFVIDELIAVKDRIIKSLSPKL